MKDQWTIFLLVLVVSLTGCAKEMKITLSEGISSPEVSSKSPESQKKDNEINLLLEPHETLGLKITDSVRKGDISVYMGVFNELNLGEYYPGRVRWNGVVRQDSDGKEFFAQFLFSPPDANRNIIWTIVVDGSPDKTAKIVQLSTGIIFGYTAFGDEFQIENPNSFLEDEDGYRARLISEKGTLLTDLQKIKAGQFYREILAKWNPWTADSGEIWSPLGTEEVAKIAAINPQYSYSQKLVAKGHFMLCADPIAIAISSGIDFIAASGASSAGWDYNSELSNRRNMGVLIAWINKLKDNNFKNALVQGGTP